MTNVPNELKIKINTSIPGFSTINYTPNMTIPNINDKSVCFNPLVKLSQNVINSVPKDKRVVEFFNKGLFNSLINYHGLQKVVSLKYAKDNGFINNNIKITLENLFPIGSVIYVNKQPYVIVDYQWSSGDWVVDTKITEAQVNYFSDPLTYIQKGKEQLQELPVDLRVGENYVGPIPTTQPPALPKAEAKIEPEAKPAEAKPAEVKPAETKAPEVKPEPIIASTELVLTAPIVSTETQITTAEISEDEKIINDYLKKNTTSVEKILEELFKHMKSTLQMIEDKSQQKINMIKNNILKCNTTYDETNTNMLQDFFEYKSYYYNLCNLIYKNMYDEITGNFIQKSLSDYLAFTTSTKSATSDINKNLSKTAYDKSVNQLKVYKSTYDKNLPVTSSALTLTPSNTDLISSDSITTNNDTYFLSIETILNRYNSLNPDNKITYETPNGIIDTFDNVTLRNIIIDGFKEMSLFNDELKLAENRVKNLNNLFKNEIVKLINSNTFTEKNIYKTTFDVYNNNPNFFVNFKILSPNNFDPFTLSLIDNIGDLAKYILSSGYRITETINHILCIKLNINVFIITQGASFEISRDNCNLYYINKNKDNFTNDCPNWKHYLFLYFNEKQNYYEEIRFNFNIPSERDPNNKLEISLFENIKLTTNPTTIIPHFYIFFLYYATIYISLTEDYKNQNTFFKDIFQKIDEIFNNIYKQQQQLKITSVISKKLSKKQNDLLKNIEKFFLYFTLLFPNQKVYLQKEYGIIQTQEQHPVNKTWLFKININENFKNMAGGRLSRFQTQYPQRFQSQYPQRFQSQYPSQYPQRFQSQYPSLYSQQYQPKIINSKNLSDTSKLAYSVTIDMELRPGTQITTSELINGKCNHKWNKIRKSYSILTGQKYVIPPIYKFTSNKTSKTSKPTINPKNKTNKINMKKYLPYGYNNYNNNFTRKYQPNKYQTNRYQPNRYQPNKYQTNRYQPNKYQPNRNYMPYEYNNYNNNFTRKYQPNRSQPNRSQPNKNYTPYGRNDYNNYNNYNRNITRRRI